MTLEPFLLRGLAAGLLLALVAAPLGCVVVWQRMAYFGETVAQASLVGVALSLLLGIDTTLAVAVVALLVAALILLLGRQTVTPMDSILGLTHHGAFAVGIIATAMLKGPSVDFASYLFGDIFAVTPADLVWLAGGGAVVAVAMWRLWPSLLRVSLDEDLAAAEGVDVGRTRTAFTLALALAIAVAMKIVGILLVIAFLVVPAVAARPFASTPERMVALAAAVACLGVLGGIGLSTRIDVPGGPAVVLVMAILAALSLAFSARRAE